MLLPDWQVLILYGYQTVITSALALYVPEVCNVRKQ